LPRSRRKPARPGKPVARAALSPRRCRLGETRPAFHPGALPRRDLSRRYARAIPRAETRDAPLRPRRYAPRSVRRDPRAHRTAQDGALPAERLAPGGGGGSGGRPARRPAPIAAPEAVRILLGR